MTDITTRLRALEADHEPDGWPAVQMRDISALMKDADSLRHELADARHQNDLLSGSYAMRGARIDELDAEVEALRTRAEAAERIAWPTARDVGRHEDMSPNGYMRVGLDSDNDVYVEVYRKDGHNPSHSVEFCNGGGGGGQSKHTRLALIALMVAMEKDNAANPARDFWARRGVLKEPKP